MRPSDGQKHALLQLLHKYYERIAEIESAHNLQVGGGDFRPRIEQFHDAIRAYTSGRTDPYASGNRLSVEYIAYDISCLREIQADPLARAGRARPLSPGVGVAVRPPGKAGRPVNPDAAVRAELMELYRNYAVFFAALLAEQADMNHRARIEDKDLQVEELAHLERMLKEQGRGARNPRAMIAEAIHDPDLQEKLLEELDKKGRRKLQSQEVLDILKASEKAIDKEIRDIETAHFLYVTSQLALYEQSKQLVQKLAREGLNLAGSFLEGAMAEAKGRGGRGV